MRSKDRLAELKDIADAAAGAVYNETVEISADDNNVPNEEIAKIFEEVDRMRSWIHEINGKTQLMRRLYTDPTFHANKHLQDQLDSAITKSNAIGLKICGALRQFEARATSATTNDATARLTRLQYAATRQLYADALGTHQLLLQSIRDQQYNLLQDQIKITNLTISDEECQNLLETKNISLFVDNVRGSIRTRRRDRPSRWREDLERYFPDWQEQVQAETQEARLALRDVEARHTELLRIEGSIKEVHELFIQMSHLVAQQQDLVDTVEYYASQAAEHVEVGGQEVMKGTVFRRKARNKKISLIICLTCGFLIVLFVLLAT